MLDFMKKLASKKAPTSADLRAALARIDEGKFAEGLLAAESARREAILTGEPEAALDRLDAACASAERAIARARIARAELEVRLAEVEQREAAAALDAERDEAEREAEVTARLIRERWPELQTEMIEMLARLDAAETKVAEINAKLNEAGRDDRVRTVEFDRARPRPKFAWEGAVSIRARTILPEIAEWNLAGIGAMLIPPAGVDARRAE